LSSVEDEGLTMPSFAVSMPGIALAGFPGDITFLGLTLLLLLASWGLIALCDRLMGDSK
jgi:hypothetical protein